MVAKESVGEREIKTFIEGLTLYKTFGKGVQKYIATCMV